MHEERWAIISPPFVNTTETCVTLSFESFSYFGALLSCINNKTGVYEERLLFRTNQSLLQKSSLSVVFLDINETASQYAQCALVFETRSKQSGTLVNINNVEMLPGRCAPPSVGKQIMSVQQFINCKRATLYSAASARWQSQHVLVITIAQKTIVKSRSSVMYHSINHVQRCRSLM